MRVLKAFLIKGPCVVRRPLFKFAVLLFAAVLFLSFTHFQISSAADGSAAVSVVIKTAREKIFENYEVFLNKGMNAAREGSWMDACALFQKAVGRRQNFAGSHLALGTAFLKLGRAKDAAETFERLALLKISSGDDTVSDELEQKIYTRFFDDAVETCRQTVIIIPQSFEMQSARASLAIYSGNYSEAAEYYNFLLKIKSDHTDARYYLGVAHHKLGNYRESIAELKKYVQSDAENAEARMFLGLNFVMLREIAAAKEEYKILNALDKDKGSLLKELIDLREKNPSGIDR